MRLHVGLGNRAEALLAYERCLRLIAGELGVDPSGELQRLFAEALR
jgi:DNA-binding SARP family transcriptional activator